MSLQAFFQWPIAIKPEKIKEEKAWFFIYTVKVIYPSPNLGLLYMMESKQNPKIPFGLCLYRLCLQSRHHEDKATVDLRGK